MGISLKKIGDAAREAIERQALSSASGAQKKRRATRDVIEALDAAIQWPGPVGRLIDLIDGPLAVMIAGVVEDEYRKHKRSRKRRAD